MSFLTRAYGATKLALKAKAPTIMVVSGVTAMGASAILAGKQTLKVEEVLEKHTPKLEKIKQGQSLELSGYTEDDASKDRFRVYGAAAVDLGRLYCVPAVLFVGGAGLVFGGHRLMVKRNATLALAFTAVQQSFEKYRQRVRDHYGDEVDQGMMSGYVQVPVGQDPVTGEMEYAYERDWDSARKDPYNRVFEQGATSQWQDNLSVNKMFLLQQQKFAQSKLNLQRYLYLNDVYEALGFPKTDIGQVTGWKVKTLEDGSRDIPMVDFGLDTPIPNDWQYNRENAIYLDFNCQGLIVGGKVQKIIEAAK